MDNSQNKPDLRVRRTHKLLFDALLLLIKEKGFDSITVSEICDRAMVHRTTFYKHYEDKYHLLYEGSKAVMGDFLASIDFLGTPYHQFTAAGIAPPRVVSFFNHVAEQKEFYQTISQIPYVNIFQRVLRDYLTEHIHLLLSSGQIQDKKIGMPISLITHFIAGAMINTLTWWLEKGMSVPPEDMAKNVALLLGHGVYHVPGIRENGAES